MAPPPNPSQLLLLADHVKLSLLERQRASSLGLPAGARDGPVRRSLQALQDGVEALEARLSNGEYMDPSSSQADQAASLRKQLDELSRLFGSGSGSGSGSRAATLSSPPFSTHGDPLLHPDEPALADALTAAARDETDPALAGSLAADNGHLASSLRRPHLESRPSKSVRFSDKRGRRSSSSSSRSSSSSVNVQVSGRAGAGASASVSAAAAFAPYRDDPLEAALEEERARRLADRRAPDQTSLPNTQIHEYHRDVLAEQDAALHVLGTSVGRQHELSLQIGDELDQHVALLDDVESGVDRHQLRLGRAHSRLGRFARKAKENSSVTVIAILAIILILLLALT